MIGNPGLQIRKNRTGTAKEVKEKNGLIFMSLDERNSNLNLISNGEPKFPSGFKYKPTPEPLARCDYHNYGNTGKCYKN